MTKILALAPDLVLAFSDLQAGIVQDLARAGLAVHLFNHRDVAGILAMVRTLGVLIDRRDAANTLADSLARRLKAIAREQQHRSPRPRVFFEEWDEPLIAAIGWVSELIEIAGGDDVCCHLRAAAAAKDRIVTPDAIAATPPGRDPRLLVRQEGRAGSHSVPPRLGSDPRRYREPDLRDQSRR
jgi:iron complex transport system substrate-binding protein